MINAIFNLILLTSFAHAEIEPGKMTLKEALSEQLKLNQDFEIVTDSQRCQCAHDLEKATAQNLKLESDQRRFTAVISCPQHPEPKACPIRGHVQLLMEIPVLTRSINPGEVITEADLNWRKVAINRVSASTITSFNELVGKISQFRMLQPGQALQRNEIKSPKIIKKGELVTVVYKTDGMVLTVQAAAKHDAAKGETVTMVSPLSKREIRAVVIAPNQAEITPVSF